MTARPFAVIHADSKRSEASMFSGTRSKSVISVTDEVIIAYFGANEKAKAKYGFMLSAVDR